MTTGVSRLIFIYNADSGALALLTDVARKLIGASECSLCDITHHAWGEKRAWRACAAALPPITYLHRDEIPADWPAALTQELPCILAETEAGERTVLVGRDALDACKADVARAELAIRGALALR